MEEVWKIQKRGSFFFLTNQEEHKKLTEEDLSTFLVSKIQKMEVNRSFLQSIGRNHYELFFRNQKNSVCIYGKKEIEPLLEDVFSRSVTKMRKKLEEEIQKEAVEKKIHISLLQSMIGSSSSYSLQKEKDTLQVIWHYPFRGERLHEEVSTFLNWTDSILEEQGPMQEGIYEKSGLSSYMTEIDAWKEDMLFEQYPKGTYQMTGKTLLKKRKEATPQMKIQIRGDK